MHLLIRFLHHKIPVIDYLVRAIDERDAHLLACLQNRPYQSIFFPTTELRKARKVNLSPLVERDSPLALASICALKKKKINIPVK